MLRPACLGWHVVLVHVQFYGMDILGNVPIVPACVSPHAVRTRTAFGMDSRGDTQIARWSTCLDLHAVLVPVQYLAWIGRAFGMNSLGDAPITRWSTCLDSQAVLVPVQYLAWIA